MYLWYNGSMFEFIDMILVRPIVNILFVIYNAVGDFGLAIILFTIIVKFLMWPMMKKQLYQAKLMKKIQPEVAKIKAESKGNRQLESIRTMELYKKYKVKPFRQILLLLIQLPIFVALYSAIRVMVMPVANDNLSNRAYPFVLEMSRISEVNQEQQRYLADEGKSEYDFHPKLFGTVRLDSAPGFTTIDGAFALICALFAAYLQYYSAKKQQVETSGKKKSFRELMAEAKAGKEPSQEEMNASMTGMTTMMMPMMMLMIMINLPGALVFYYLISTAISLAQQELIFKQKISRKELEEEMKIDTSKIQEAKIIENKKTGTKITKTSGEKKT